MTELTVQGLHKAFGSHPVLTGIELTAPAGSLTAILGPSGSGKTTLLRILAGFEQADAGVVRIGGTTVDGPGAHLPPERRQIGYVPQEGSLFPHLTVAANVGFGLPARERRGPRTAELLDAVGLAGLGKRYPHQLSGGQQQRVALARALAIRPQLVLLDEPFASLDAHLRASVRADVQQIFRDSGTTAILVTHDQDEALSMADRVAVLRNGQIAQCAAPQELYARPADPDLARFIGEANLLDGLLTGEDACAGASDGAVAGGPAAHGAGRGAGRGTGRGAGGWVVETVFGLLSLEPSAVPPAAAGPVTVLIRPEQVELAGPAGPADGPGAGPGCLAGQIVACDYYGHDAVLRVRPMAGERTVGGPSDGERAAGERVDGGPAMPDIIVRTVGGPQFSPGALVRLRARGPVLAWPRS